MGKSKIKKPMEKNRREIIPESMIQTEVKQIKVIEMDHSSEMTSRRIVQIEYSIDC